MNEVRILASVENNNIVMYKEAFYDETQSCLCIIMEFVGGGDMLQKIETFRKKKLKFSEKMA